MAGSRAGRFVVALAAAVLTALGTAGPQAAVAAGSTPEEEGVTGQDGALYVSQDLSAFMGLGGTLLAAPAVVSVPNTNGISPGTPIFIGLGNNHSLYVRSTTQAWQSLTSTPHYCIDAPAGVVVLAHAAGSYVLTVACQGSDHALWYAQEQISVGVLPTGPVTFHSLGGGMVAGPAVAPVAPISNLVDGELTFFVNGLDGRVWSRSIAAGWMQMPWGCIGHPAAGGTLSAAPSVPSGEITVFACQGLDHQMWSATNRGMGWSPAMPLGGGFIDGPGVAVGPNEAAFYGEGLDHQSWHKLINHDGTVGAWMPDGGVLQFGAGAAALLFQNANP
jgi:hypothetical protein